MNELPGGFSRLMESAELRRYLEGVGFNDLEVKQGFAEYLAASSPQKLTMNLVPESRRVVSVDSLDQRALTDFGVFWLAVASFADTPQDRFNCLRIFAVNSIEHEFFTLLFEKRPDLFDPSLDSTLALIRLRALAVPALCQKITVGYARGRKESGMLLWEYSTRVVARNRFVAEFLMDRDLDLGGKPNESERQLFQQFSKLSKAELLTLLLRYDEWQASALRSFWFYAAKQSACIRFAEGCLSQILALAGHTKRSDFGTESDLGKLASVILSGVEKEDTYTGAQRKRIKETRELGLKTWLIEVWPLVRRYGWSYLDIHRALALRTNSDKGPKTPKQLGKMCEHLQLTINGKGCVSNRSLEEHGDPYMARFGALIKGLGESKRSWFRGAHAGLRGRLFNDA